MKCLLIIFSSFFIEPDNQANYQMLPDSICVEICQLYAQDQMLRTRDVYKRYPNEMNKILPMLDSINFKKALRIIKEFGFPNSTNTPQHFRGKECVKMGLIAIMLHNPKRVFDNKEVFLEAFSSGKVSGSVLSSLFDKYYVTCEGRSYYGTPFMVWTKQKGVSIADKEKSTALRKELGLEPLEDDFFVE